MDDNNKERRMEKTFIEGAEPAESAEPVHELKAGTKISVTSPAVGTSYGKNRSDDTLPSGKEPVPLGSGTVVCSLGTGGMARVYKIWNEKLEVHRAVKIILPSHQSDLMSRFETEVKISAKLHHPNIVDIYSVGDWKGLPYLEMEFLDGESLEAVIARTERLPEMVSSAIAIFVARALVYAHTQKILIYGKTYNGIVHRDLKPANIMITRDGTVKLMDFGIARPSETSLHTVEGSIVGTLPYLAPEQIDGTDIDGRVDVYALGTILYEMITGTKTFPQKSITNLMKSKITNSYRRFEDLDLKVHTGLAKIAHKCLQVSKDERYGDAGELLDALLAAHHSLTPDSPENVMKAFLADPTGMSVAAASKPKARIKIGPKVLIPAAAAVGAAVLVGLVAVFLATGPKPKTTAAAAVTPAGNPRPAIPPVKHDSALAAAAPLGPGELKPLGAAPQPQVAPGQAAPAAPSVKPRVAPPGAAAPAPRITKPASDEAATAGKKSPLDMLKQRYGTDDLMAIAQKAVQRRAYADAVAALEEAPPGAGDPTTKSLLLLEADVGLNRNKDALFIINGEQINDALFSLLAGKTYYNMRKTAEALDYFEGSLQKPSKLKSRKEVVDEALYNIAIIRSDGYKSDPSPDKKAVVMQAWVSVKTALQTNPDDARYKRAVTELASIH